MAQAYCNNCKEILSVNGNFRKTVCNCGSKDFISVKGVWIDKCGWDYFDRAGNFVTFIPHIPYGETGQPQEETTKPKIAKQLTLSL